MPRIAIVADTHVPSRATGVPDWVEDRIGRADHTIHAGDFDSKRAYDRIVDLAEGELTSVSGNADPASLEVPSAATLEAGKTTFVATHGTGSPAGWYQRVVETAREQAGSDAIAVAGHTHEVVDTTVDGVRVLDPGSATGANPADRETMLVATVDNGDVAVETLTE